MIFKEKIFKTQEKFYLADTSLKYYVLGYDSNSITASLENIIYLELRRRNYTVHVEKMNNNKIDFIVLKQNNKLYIQVTQEINSEKTQQRKRI